jgi:serine/threonine protein phosphatase PrpC
MWTLLVLGVGLTCWCGLRPGPRRKRFKEVHSEERRSRRRHESRPLPRTLEPGDDLDITVIKAAPAELTELDGDDVSELRPSRVGLIYEDEAEVDEPTTPAARILMVASGESDRGLVRQRNEDRLFMSERRSVFAVADGMGGHQGGEVASELAVTTLEDAYSRRCFQGVIEASGPVPRRARELSLAMQMANHAVHERSKTTPLLSEMGTTLLVAKFSPRKQRVYIGHVGDSRCYRIRDSRIRQLTTDHNLGAFGATGAVAARLSRAVGIGGSVDIDVIVDRPLANDVYCLCSDGLTKMVQDEEIRAIVERKPNVEAAVSALIELANDRGGRDNVTVILIRVVESSEQRAGATAALG